MVFIKFEGFILVLLLVSFALQDLCVHGVHHQESRFVEGNSVKETRENDASLNKELVGGTMRSISGSKAMKIVGRKMGMTLKKEDGDLGSRSSTGDAQKLNVEADKNASKEGPQAFLNNQGQENSWPKQGFSPIANPTSFNKNMVISSEDQSDEWRKLLEDADKKVMQMMRRDYSGMRRPRRKPPINNYEPRN